MKMVSTKRSAKDLKPSAVTEKYTPDPYSYSTRLCLDKDLLDKLGIRPTDFKVGQNVTVQAKAVVRSLRQSEGKDHSSNEVELQLTSLGLEKTPSGGLRAAVDKAVKDAS